MSSYQFSSTEIKQMTGWPDPLVDEWIELVQSINDALLDLNSVRGSADSSGAGTGTGFSSVKSSTGTYDITFDVAKDSLNYVILPGVDTQGYIISYTGKSLTGFTIKITNSSGTLADSGFNFMVKEWSL